MHSRTPAELQQRWSALILLVPRSISVVDADEQAGVREVLDYHRLDSHKTLIDLSHLLTRIKNPIPLPDRFPSFRSDTRAVLLSRTETKVQLETRMVRSRCPQLLHCRVKSITAVLSTSPFLRPVRVEG